MRLPESAKRPLAPGESYDPPVPAGSSMAEVTIRSVVTGLVMTLIFSLVAAYLALKVGQGIEAAIPIAILAIGLGKVLPRRSTILENVIIQSIGANSSHVVAGAVFTIPALYMLAGQVPGLEPPAWYITLITAFLGGSFGILFLSPLRHYFMVEEHGKLPWPEATATTEILASGEAAGGQALVLILSTLWGGIYEFCGQTLKVFRDVIDFASVQIPRFLGPGVDAAGQPHTIGSFLAGHYMTLRINNLAAIVGVGYIIGLKYAAIICAGSFVSYFVLVPLVHAFGSGVATVIPPGEVAIGAMSIDQIFKSYVRMIGIGGIAGAGVIGIVSAFPSMVRSIALGLRGMGHGAAGLGGGIPRTERSLTMKETGLGLGILAAGAFLFFLFGLGVPAGQALLGLGIVLAFAFLFAPVSARAIALVGTNPVSGMTLMTLIITAVVFLQVGLKGATGITVALVVGGTVCTALAAAGALSSDLKVGHWIGATPRNQLLLKFLGTLVAAGGCALAMTLLSRSYTFGSNDFPAPQASAMKEIIWGLMGSQADQGVRWQLFSLGVILALILRMVGLPVLAFALGMYLPIQLNVPVMIGGFLSYLVVRKRSGEPEERTKAGHEKGVLIASGLIAGGGLMGIVDAVLASIPSGVPRAPGAEGPAILSVKETMAVLPETGPGWTLGREGEWISIAFLAALCLFVCLYARSGRRTAAGGE